jgi:hypothetical protein
MQCAEMCHSICQQRFGECMVDIVIKMSVKKYCYLLMFYFAILLMHFGISRSSLYYRGKLRKKHDMKLHSPIVHLHIDGV